MSLAVSSFRYSRLERRVTAISKVILLRVYGDYIEHVWDKLPEHMKIQRFESIVAATVGILGGF